MNEPLLLLPFTGTNGGETTADISLYANPTFITPGLATTSTTNEKFAGVLSLDMPQFDPLTVTAPCYVPFASGSALDIFRLTGGWTIEGWFNISSDSGVQLFLVTMNGTTAVGFGGYSFVISAVLNGDNTITLSCNDYATFGSGATRTATYPASTPGTWHHFAIVNNGTLTTLYADGIAGGTYVSWNAANYGGPFVNANSPNVVIGSFSGYSGVTQAGYISQIRISGYPVYTSNFTPPSGPFTVFAPTGQGDITDPFAWQDSTGTLPPIGFANDSDGSNF